MKPTNTSTPLSSFSGQTAMDDRSMPLGISEMTGDENLLDPLASAGTSRRFRSGSLMIVFVIAIACCGLWFMRSLSHVSGANGEKSDIEQSIEQFLGARDSRGEVRSAAGRTDPKVLQVLNESLEGKFVPLSSVQRDPFVLPGEGESKVVTPVAGEDPAQAVARARALRQKDIDEAAANMVVKSIIMSTQPLANISGTIVRIGDEIAPEGFDVTFRVQAITTDSVTLVSDDLALGMHVETQLSMKRDK